ncbi:hypothetical protein GSY71_17725 [Pusillimonas sp. TS35]|nr:hypothetical protein [Pusillimonas sp. TS35]
MTDSYAEERGFGFMKDRTVVRRNATPLGPFAQSQVLDSWAQVAPLMLVKTMKTNKITYKDLEKRLKDMGVHESASRLNRKVNRQSFSAAFFLMCMSAMRQEGLPVPTTQEVMERFARTKE